MDSDDEDIDRDFNKAASTVYKLGYREGTLDGKNKNLQEGFDLGFQNGIKLGLAVGFYKGLINEVSNDTKVKRSDECEKSTHLAKSDKLFEEDYSGKCTICGDSKLVDSPYEDVNTIQSNHNNVIIEELMDKYSIVVKEIGINDADLKAVVKINNL